MKKSIPAIKCDLDIDWSELENETDVNSAYQLFHTHLISTINKYTEHKTVRIPYKKIIKEPWLTKGIIKANKKQLLLYKEWLTK